MTDHPILYQPEMARAAWEGRKTQTRRLLNYKNSTFDGSPCPKKELDLTDAWLDCGFESAPRLKVTIKCKHETTHRIRPKYQVGDRLWVRESWSGEHFFSKWSPSTRYTNQLNGYVNVAENIWYWADGNPEFGDWERPRPSIHMPRWASRMTQIVTDVRIERLQDISEADAKAEGCPLPNTASGPYPREAFADLINSINGPATWDSNPWVVAYTFKTHRCNIDQMDT